MSRQSTKNKKYALRKIGKFFGSCAVATVITLSGAAIMAPNVTVYANEDNSKPVANKIDNINSASEGYEVFVPKGKKYERDDTVESHEPKLKEEGYNGRSFILKAEPNDNLPESDIKNYFYKGNGNELENLFEKLYDKDDDNQIDEKYKRADADTINENAGNPIGDSNFVEPKVSEVNPKYPHRLDAGADTPANPGNLYKGRPAGADGNIDDDDTIVESNKPITVNPNSDKNIVNDDGTVELSKYYRIHVNEGEHADKKDDIYVVGTKPKVERTPIPFSTRYERDDSVPEGTENEVTAGKDGEKVTTTTYELNVQTGEVTPNEPTSVTTDPVTRVVKRGTQPKVEKTPIPFPTRYERDDSVPEGTENEVTAGVNGETVKTTTYEINPDTGVVTANEPKTATTDPVTRVVKRGTQPKVEKTPIPFPTRYERDDSVPEGTENEVTAGKDGETVKTTTYELNPTTGEVTANAPTTATTDPVTRVVKRGTQPKVEKTPIPFPTRYEEDNSIPEGEEREVTAGVNGETVKTTTYELNPTTGEVTANEPTTTTTNPVTRVVKRGTQPKVEKTPIPFPTRYERDDSVPEGTENEVTAGKDGETVKTTTYELNPTTGEVTANDPTTATTDPVTRVVKRGTQPKVEKTPIPFPTRYERDDSVPEGTENEVTAGVNGETVKTTTYEINPDTGVVTANEPTSKTTDPVTRVVKRGTQPKVEKTPIPFPTRYERDDSVPEGTENEVTAGVDGETVKTTTYEINADTGVVTANEPTTKTTDAVTRVVKRGTQPKVEKTPIPFPTRYERDDSVPEGTENEVTAGKDGETVKTTTYELNPTTGEVTANDPTTATTDPVTRVVKRGTQPKVEKTPIPFETRYEEDNSIPEGEEREVTAGVNGETVKTTTYEINPDTGVVTANEPKTATTDPVTRVVKRGTQPKPTEGTPSGDKPTDKPTEGTPSGDKPTDKPTEGTPSGDKPTDKPTEGTPSGDKPTDKPTEGTPSGDKPTDKPTEGTPSGDKPTDKPTEGTPETPQPETGINVLPPTPRIVERPGGNTVEVGVPTKDADTLSITFTKRNSTEKETIVTKKDEDGKWKIEKAPDGVTINPTNGLVYIPSKQIEPKTYVDTQTKHKNKESKIVSVMPNIHDLKEFEATTEWIDVNGNVLKTLEKGIHEKEEFASYVWLESVLEGNKIRHIYFEGTPSVDKPEYKITVWFDEDGNPIKPDQPGTHESGEIPGYKFIKTTTKDGITTHIFEKVANGSPILPERPTSHPKTPSSSPSTSTPEKPNKAQTPSPEQPASPAPSKVSEQKGEAVATATSEKTVDSATSTKTSDKAELPNTGTEANANLAALGLLGALSGFGLLARKKKED